MALKPQAAGSDSGVACALPKANRVTADPIRSGPTLLGTVLTMALGPAILILVWWLGSSPDQLPYCVDPFFSIRGAGGDMLWFAGLVLTAWGVVVGFLRFRWMVWSLHSRS